MQIESSRRTGRQSNRLGMAGEMKLGSGLGKNLLSDECPTDSGQPIYGQLTSFTGHNGAVTADFRLRSKSCHGWIR
jgi:hypothetical protein